MNSAELRDASDGVLTVAIARGRRSALEEAYNRHAGVVFAISMRVSADRALAEDVVQEVFFHLWQNPEKYDPTRGSLRSYLLAHAHSKSVDLLRSENARRNREEREGRMQGAGHDDLEKQVWDISIGEQVRGALADLIEEERRAIELAYFGGYTYREVAAMLNQPEGTVKSRIRAGLRRLRGVLKEAGVSL